MEYPEAIDSDEAYDLRRIYNIWDRDPSHYHHPDLRPSHSTFLHKLAIISFSTRMTN